MDHLNTIYRNYDIRGKYPSEINETEVEGIGRALVVHLGLNRIAIGRDIRPSGDALFTAMTRGITEQGGDVIDLGIVTTPMTYFACDDTVDATVMITASHMGPQFNGLKMCFSGGIPFPAKTLKEIETQVRNANFVRSPRTGTVSVRNIKDEWVRYFQLQFSFATGDLKVVVDPANMVGVLEIETLKQLGPGLTVHSIYDTFDPTCPNHEANPLKYDTLRDLSAEVLNKQAHIGIAFDGDADRVGFVDETGAPVSADLIGILIAKYLLEREPGSAVVYDLRSSKAVREQVETGGGVAHESPVGHINVRSLMRETGAIFGAEVSGHFFFKSMRYSEGGVLPALIILDIMRTTNRSLSSLIDEVRTYHKSEEINTEIERHPEQVYQTLMTQYEGATFSRLDGLTVTHESWWFNIRPSANDPVIRLNLEADTAKLRDEKIAEVLSLIVW